MHLHSCFSLFSSCLIYSLLTRRKLAKERRACGRIEAMRRLLAARDLLITQPARSAFPQRGERLRATRWERVGEQQAHQGRRFAMAKRTNKTGSKPRCGLCGKTGKVTKTLCCDHWICDDSDTYVLFSYARNSCWRNHDRYTLCAYHSHEGHTGAWQTCTTCRESFDTEDYVEMATNESNFEKLQNPPSYEPTTCAECGQVIIRAHGGYSMVPNKGFVCGACSLKDFKGFL